MFGQQNNNFLAEAPSRHGLLDEAVDNEVGCKDSLGSNRNKAVEAADDKAVGRNRNNR